MNLFAVKKSARLALSSTKKRTSEVTDSRSARRTRRVSNQIDADAYPSSLVVWETGVDSCRSNSSSRLQRISQTALDAPMECEDNYGESDAVDGTHSIQGNSSSSSFGAGRNGSSSSTSAGTGVGCDTPYSDKVPLCGISSKHSLNDTRSRGRTSQCRHNGSCGCEGLNPLKEEDYDDEERDTPYLLSSGCIRAVTTIIVDEGDMNPLKVPSTNILYEQMHTCVRMCTHIHI